LFRLPGVTVESVVRVVTCGPLQRERGNGSEEVPDGPGHYYIVEK
jgi:hypothetical protein